MKLSRFWSVVRSFFGQLFLSIRLMTKTEHILLYILLALILIEIAYKGYGIYFNNTMAVPAQGGVYKEVTVGEIKYLNPIITKTDAERSISHLIYSGLVRFDLRGNIAPDLAERWEISSDGLTYRFYLKDNVFFHNGEPFEAQDVVNTLAAIKNPDTKSPYHDIWKDVEVNAPDKKTVELKIPRQYGSFIFNCTQGIAASDNLQTSLTDVINGTGPYHLRILKDNTDGSKYLELDKYNFYYGTPPFISVIEFTVYKDALPDSVKNHLNDFTAVAGESTQQLDYLNYSFKVGRSLMLIPNLKNAFLADAANRAKLFKMEKFDSPVKLKLITVDAVNQKAKIEELKKGFQDKNVEIDYEVLSSVDFLNKAQKRDFDLILYGTDYGPDRDPYTFWHSSQIGKDNFASYANKQMDIQLEDARMILDYNDRNKKYDDIFNQLASDNLAIFYPPIKYSYAISPELKGIGSIVGFRPEDRFNTITNWYLGEERIKKR